MIFADTRTNSDGMLQREGTAHMSQQKDDLSSRRASLSWFLMVICLLLACIGTSWFAYQYFFVSQAKSFEPDWKNSQWIQATDGIAPVAYFRSVKQIEAIPDGAFLTVAANQTFRVYVNETFIGSNEGDFFQGDASRPYIFDIASALQRGSNVIVIRVVNLNQHTPAVRAALHLVIGAFSQDYGTDNSWRATTQSHDVFPGYVTNLQSWGDTRFDATAWPLARAVRNAPALSTLTVDPRLYEQPVPRLWLSAGAGSQAYFVRQIVLSTPVSNVWLRFAATSPANIFVNGHLFVNWTGKPPAKNVVGSLDYLEPGMHIRRSFIVGIYDMAPYLHRGTNTLAMYVSSPNTNGLLDRLSASVAVDMLISTTSGHDTWDEAMGNWRASANFVAQWQQASAATQRWQSATPIARPLLAQQSYLPDSGAILQRSDALQNAEVISLTALGKTILFSIVMVIGLWLAMTLLLGKRYYGTTRNALMVMSVAYIPAIACEMLLMILAREPMIPHPFPYNTVDGSVLIALVVVAYLLLWLQGIVWAKAMLKHRRPFSAYAQDMLFAKGRMIFSSSEISCRLTRGFKYIVPSIYVGSDTGRARRWLSSLCKRILAYLRVHWTMLPLLCIATWLIFSTLGYEPYWQDELVSYYVAKNSIAHGFPMMPSGFVYPKAELFEYMLGLFMLVFGDQGITPRLLSALEFIVSIPLLYSIGCYFFGRRVSWLATAMLAVSPFALVWGAQLRMYEQAQVCVLVVVYIFYKAARYPRNTCLPYIAIFCLIITYLSHEETFIILPGLVLCVFIISKEHGRPLPAVFYQKHWWLAALLGASALGIQLLNVRFSHPPVLGTDQSMRPDVQLNENGVPFYLTLLFNPKSTNTWLPLNSVLAALGCFWALRSKNSRLRYCALLVVSSLAVLAFVFTLEADRYFYPLLPVYYLIGAYVIQKTLRCVWRFACTHIASGLQAQKRSALRVLFQPIKLMALVTACMVYTSVLIAPMLPLSNYNVGVSQLLGLPYHRHFADYDLAGQYVRQHWRSGDIMISISPDIEMYYYIGRSDYYFSIDRALFLIEHHGHIVNTSTAAIAILSQADFQSVLEQHARIWLVSDHSQYESVMLKRFAFPTDFHIVYEGARDVVYLRGG